MLGDLAGYAALELARRPIVEVDAVDEALQVVREIELRAHVPSPEGALIEIERAPSNLPVGTLQSFLDAHVEKHAGASIDYIHGADVARRLAAAPHCTGFLLPALDKRELFRSVILDGALPRKTFSMGEADEKRFYLEARRILPAP